VAFSNVEQRPADKEEKMYQQIQKSMIGHGALILLVAMFSGIGLLVARLGGLELVPGEILSFSIPGAPDAWARVHVGGLLNAFLIFLVALMLPVLGFSIKAATRLGWVIIATGWANSLFYWAALFAPNRALSFGANRYGEGGLIAAIGLAPALLFVFLSLIAVGVIAIRAFSSSEKRQGRKSAMLAPDDCSVENG
jgi:hypothetical protein